MKKTIIISIALFVLVLAFLAWGYLFLFGTPEGTDDIFTDLGFTITPQATNPLPVEEEFVAEPQTMVDVAGVALRQLTLRPVAGFIGLTDGEERLVRYAERGTGHIYELNLTTGSEQRISNTTNARVVNAWFGTTGEYLALQTEDGYRTSVLVGNINNPGEGGSLATTPLTTNGSNVVFIATSTLHYTTTENNGTTGYEYSVSNASQSIVFTVPFRSIRTETIGGVYFATNRYAPELLGGLYRVTSTSYDSLIAQRYGLTTLLSPNWLAYSANSNNETRTYALNQNSGESVQLPLPVTPEKCTFSSAVRNTLWCAAPLTAVSHTYLKEWYQGARRANDAIWRVSLSDGTGTLISNPPTAVGRELDVIKLTLLPDETSLLFINKNDDTLWQYDFLAE